jgi:hypothetical protein
VPEFVLIIKQGGPQAEGSWLASGLYKAVLWTQLRCGDEKPTLNILLKFTFTPLGLLAEQN